MSQPIRGERATIGGVTGTVLRVRKQDDGTLKVKIATDDGEHLVVIVPGKQEAAAGAAKTKKEAEGNGSNDTGT